MCAVELRRGGLHLTGTPLWLDATRKQELSFVSHAHSDHIGRHERTIATPATLRLMQHRLGKLKSPLAAPYRKGFELGRLWLELLPAGHILGSAQLRVVREDGARVVYTGDLNLAPSLTAEAAEIAECDVLVIESTFGHPRYRFPPKAQTLEAIARWTDACLTREVTPVLLGYPLGKSQEAIKHLNAAGFRLCAHRSICDLAELYAELGTPLGPLRCFDGRIEPGEVAFFPPNIARGRALATRSERAVLTGWALDPGAHRRYGADLAFPLSDHADFEMLVSYAKATGAGQVITLHGFDEELARALRAEGLDARAVGTVQQLDLFPGAEKAGAR
jgi:putative mRNA 3-end processing factor